MQPVIENLGLLLSKKQKMLELRMRDGMRKIYKSQLLDYFISVTVMRLDLRWLPILLLRIHQFQTRY